MKKEKSNYSYETSLPPYLENKALNKQRQCDMVLEIIKRKANNLLQISQVSGIPQAIISARVNDLIKESKVAYLGKVIYNNRLRKQIVFMVHEVEMGKQSEIDF